MDTRDERRRTQSGVACLDLVRLKYGQDFFRRFSISYNIPYVRSNTTRYFVCAVSFVSAPHVTIIPYLVVIMHTGFTCIWSYIGHP